jgi:hypothetical protein
MAATKTKVKATTKGETEYARMARAWAKYAFENHGNNRVRVGVEPWSDDLEVVFLGISPDRDKQNISRLTDRVRGVRSEVLEIARYPMGARFNNLHSLAFVVRVTGPDEGELGLDALIESARRGVLLVEPDDDDDGPGWEELGLFDIGVSIYDQCALLEGCDKPDFLEWRDPLSGLATVSIGFKERPGDLDRAALDHIFSVAGTKLLAVETHDLEDGGAFLECLASVPDECNPFILNRGAKGSGDGAE